MIHNTYLIICDMKEISYLIIYDMNLIYNSIFNLYLIYTYLIMTLQTLKAFNNLTR